eukprot:gene24216-37333_t
MEEPSRQLVLSLRRTGKGRALTEKSEGGLRVRSDGGGMLSRGCTMVPGALKKGGGLPGLDIGTVQMPMGNIG